MTKAAVHNLTKNLAREWGPPRHPLQRARARLLPGRAEPRDPHPASASDGHHRPHADGAVRRRRSELIGATLLLASDAGRFITGAEIVVDGGFGAMTI